MWPPTMYLTLDEAAAALRVSERTVRRWIARGALIAQKVGGTVRVPWAAVTTASSAAARPRRGRPPKPGVNGVSALSQDVFASTWENPEDAVYDRWREIYGLREG